MAKEPGLLIGKLKRLTLEPVTINSLSEFFKYVLLFALEFL